MYLKDFLKRMYEAFNCRTSYIFMGEGFVLWSQVQIPFLSFPNSLTLDMLLYLGFSFLILNHSLIFLANNNFCIFFGIIKNFKYARESYYYCQ